ncbi:NADP-dependent oxidoreductase domain-containing protein [Radiomyces spectabilis]|uniref:NADP-dependent oxidoreductase domain-containing protein n=1 Tax=Radiomyces spectabilis TaxID=64574 RepID=UPI002220F2E1|nr:NADP-dependent oxidoreductase domain-containing protein [Radiomyces spectabilis]KAI8374111.1 NADP-dependent oxidoreductase domain-containing protein [Radiomyces spectabilis]
MVTNVPTIKLNSGYDLPMIGYGTFGGKDAPHQVYDATKVALEAGYRHFDTAFLYETEEALGKAIRESNVPREEVFVTTKLWQTFHKPEHVRPACEKSLELLQFDYIDQYMMHWPMAWEFRGYEFKDIKVKDENNDIKCIDVPIIDTWKAMEQLVKDGLVRTIGVSNFTIPMLEDLLRKCEIPPAVNQVEIHPSLPQEELLEYCKSKGIALTAYSPLGNPGYSQGGVIKTLEEPVVLQIAEKYGKTPVQILLNWGVARGYAVIPKSVTPSRIKANIEYFKMDPADVEAITAIGRGKPVRTCDPVVMFGISNDVFSEHKK